MVHTTTGATDTCAIDTSAIDTHVPKTYVPQTHRHTSTDIWGSGISALERGLIVRMMLTHCKEDAER